MSPASLMTLGPCSTPPVFCPGGRTGVRLLYYFCQTVFLVQRVVSRVCVCKSLYHLSSRKRSAQHRHRLGSARLARVAQLGPKKPEQGSSQRHVSLLWKQSRPSRCGGHRQQRMAVESDESSARCCAAGCCMWRRWCKGPVLWVQTELININEM